MRSPLESSGPSAFCATREFRQTRTKNKSVFNRQVRPKRYLFPIAQVLQAISVYQLLQ